jgi:CelD/BcsL family acetyltransferase involved in cellulose biosynthesis
MSMDKTVRIIDFGFGPDEYKKRFGNANRREVSVRIFGPTVQGYSMNALATVCEAITRGGRKIAQSSGLYPFLKKAVRKLLSRNSQ